MNITDKIEEKEKTEDKFGYKGLHFDCTLNEVRKVLAEYMPFKDVKFEIQIRTIVQDAWSVLDHKIKYKKEISTDLKRRINLLSAIFEVADNEFQAIKKATIHEIEGNQKESSELVATEADESPIELKSFMQFCKEKFPDYNFYTYRADDFVHEILKLDKGFSVKRLAQIYEKTNESISKYREESLFGVMNPYTILRHILFLENRDTFEPLLFETQRKNFLFWLEREEVACD